MLAGPAVRDLILKQLNGIGNVMNIQSDAYTAYDNLEWGIEARNDNGMVRTSWRMRACITYLILCKVKYIFRNIPYVPNLGPGPGLIRYRDGDEILFGQGFDGEKLGRGPLLSLCNLQLAVARVLKMSGAAEVITQLMEDADDMDFPLIFQTSEDFSNLLTAKLSISGRALIV